MATTKERLLVTLTPHSARTIRSISKRERMPRATVAARMIDVVVTDIKNSEDTDLTPQEERELVQLVKERDTSDAVWLTEKEANALYQKLHRSYKK